VERGLGVNRRGLNINIRDQRLEAVFLPEDQLSCYFIVRNMSCGVLEFQFGYVNLVPGLILELFVVINKMTDQEKNIVFKIGFTCAE